MKVRGSGQSANLRRSVAATAVASCFACTQGFGPAHANPTGEAVKQGAATFQRNGGVLQITNSPNAVIHWQGFSIDRGELTRFIQQNPQSAVLNRVAGASPSAILGALESNGRVFLINPNGILFGAGAQVNVSGLVASSLNLTDADFVAGRMRFEGEAGARNVVNRGTITAGPGGQVYLIAPNVKNSGVITTPKGEVVLAAGSKVELADTQTPLLRVEVAAAEGKAVNVGTIMAEGGRVSVYGTAIRNSGTISANTLVRGENGEILLKAKKDVLLTKESVITASGPSAGKISIEAETGAAQIAGRIEANATEKGGTIDIRAQREITVDAQALVTANGPGGGGTVTLNSASGTTRIAGAIEANALSSSPPAQISSSPPQGEGQGGGGVARGGTIAITADKLSIPGSVKADGASGGQVTIQATSIAQSGTITADATTGKGGVVDLQAVESVAQDMGAIVSASSTAGDGGAITIMTGPAGKIVSSANLQVTAGGIGGAITVTAREVELRESNVDASGDAGGGLIRLGGDYQGKGTIPNSRTLFVDRATRIRANARREGDGGRVILWSDEDTRAYGEISARGGPLGGDGGFVETSSRGYLDVLQLADASAPKGKAGTWLLDPFNLTISNNASAFVTGFDAAATGANIQAVTIQSALNGGTSVTVTTGASGGETGNLTVFGTGDLGGAVNINKTTGAAATLTLQAAGSIDMHSGSIIQSTAAGNALGLTLNAGSGTTIASTVSLNGGTLTIGGTTTAMLASGASVVNATLTASAGAGIATSTSATTTLNGVTLDADLNISNAATVNVQNGLTLANAHAITLSSLGSGAGLTFQGNSQTLGGTGEVRFGGSSTNDTVSASLNAGQTLTIGSGITVHSSTASGTIDATRAIVNQGVIAADVSGRTITVSGGGGLTNEGMLSAQNGATLSSITATLSNATGAQITAAGGTLSVGGTTFTNGGTAKVTSGTLTINPTSWDNSAGTLDIQGGTANLGGFSTANLGTFVRGGSGTAGTVNLVGTMNNPSTFNFDSTTYGVWNLAGGTVNGGTLTASAGLVANASTASTLIGVTLDADLNVSNAATVNVQNGLTLANAHAITLSSLGSGAGLTFQGNSQTLGGTGEVRFGGSSTNDTVSASLNAGQTLTIGSGITVHSSTASGTIDATRAIVNQGVIAADVSGRTITVSGGGGLTNEGMLSAQNGATLSSITATLSNATGAQITAAGGTLSVGGTTFTNGGTAKVTSGTLTINPTSWDNSAGTLDIQGGTANLGGFSTANLGTFVRGGSGTAGTVNLVGTMNNPSTFNFDSTTYGVWNLAGGTVNGGTLTASAGLVANASTASTLIGVTLDADLNVSNAATVNVQNGLTLANAHAITLSSLGSGAGLTFQGNSQTLGGTGEVRFGGSSTNDTVSASLNAGQTLTIGSGITVHSSTASGTIDATRAIVNQGVIAADVSGRTITVSGGGGLTNEGMLSAQNGATLSSITATLSNATGAQITAAGGTLSVGGTTFTNGGTAKVTSGTLTINPTSWDNSAGTLDIQGGTANLGGFSTANLGTFVRGGSGTAGTVNLVGTMNNPSTFNFDSTTYGVWNLAGGTVNGGTLTASAGLVANASTASTLIGVTLDADLNVSNAATVNVQNGLTLANAHAITLSSLGSGAGLTFQGNSQTLGGTGEVRFGGSSTNDTVSASLNAGQTLTIGSGITVHSSTASGTIDATRAIVNQGVIAADVSGRTITVSGGGGLTNEGMLSAQNGATLSSITATLSNATGAQITAAGGTLSVGGTTFTNGGTAKVTSGTLTINPTSWDNSAGTLDIQGGTANLGGFSTANLGTFVRGGSGTAGTVNLVGTMNNPSTFNFDSTTYGVWNLAGGTVNGGTLTASAGLVANASTASTLIGVTLDADLNVSNAATVNVQNGLTLANAHAITLSSLGSGAGLTFQGNSQTLGGTGEVRFGGSSTNDTVSASLNAGQTLTIGSGITVHSSTASGTIDATRAIVNQGVIAADVSGRTITVSGGGGLTNEGTLSAQNGATFSTSTTTFPSNAGVIDVGTGSTFSTSGVIGTTLTNLSSGIIRGRGTLTLGGANRTLTNNGTLKPGASPGMMTITGDLTLASGSVTEFEMSGYTRGADPGYDSFSVSGDVTIAPGATANLIYLSPFTTTGTNPGDSFLAITAGGTASGTFTIGTFPSGPSGVEPFVTQTVGSTVFLQRGTVFTSVNVWNTDSNGNWNDITKWSTGSLPGIGQTVIVDRGNANPVITITDSQLTGKLQSTEAITISGGTLDVTDNSTTSGLFTLSSGTLTGNGTLTAGGTVTWSGGTITGTGGFVTSASSTTTLTSLTPTLSGRTWTSQGTVTQAAGSRLNLQDAAVVNIESGSVWDLTTADTSPLNYNSGALATVNVRAGGVLNKDANAAQTINTTFTNAGVVNVNAGTLTLNAGGSYTGSFDVDGPATFRLNGGTQNFGSGASVTGAGTLLADSGTVNFNTGSSPGIVATGTVSTAGATLNFSSGGTLTFTNGLSLSSGTLTGSDPLVVPAFSWSGGVVSGTGSFETPANSVTTLTTLGPVLSGRTWTSRGTVTQAAGSRLNLQDAAVVNIESGSVWNLTTADTSPLNYNSGALATVNVRAGGVLNKDANAAQTINTTFTNAGVVNVNAGTLTLNAGGSYTGSFDVDGPATFRLNGGTQNFGSGASVTGAGTLLADSGTVNFNTGSSPGIVATGTVSTAGATLNFSSGGTLTFTNGLSLSSGTLTGSDPLVVPAFSWSGGVVSGTGSFETPANSVTTLTTLGPVLSGRTWTSRGTVTQAAGSRLNLQDAAVVNIESGSVWNLTTADTSPLNYNSGALATVNVRAGGVLNKDANAAQTINTTFTNAGVVNVNAGTLTLSSFPTNNGTIDVEGGAVAISGSFTNNGVLTLKGTGVANTLSVTGNLTLAAGSVVNTELGGTGAGQFGNIHVTGTATLDGTLNVTHAAGFTPGPGNSFAVLTYGARSGNFAATNLPAGFSYSTLPGATSYVLQLSAACTGTICWDNDSGDFQWTNPLNWSTNTTLPGLNDDVVINVGGTTTVLFNTGASYTIHSLASQENLNIQAGTLVLDNASSSINATLTLSGGTLTSTGSLTASNVNLSSGTLNGAGAVTVSNALNWSGGTLGMSGQAVLTGTASTWSGGVLSGNLRVAPGGTLTLNGSGAKLFANGGSLLNEGTVNWTAGNIEPAGGNGTATITNASSGVFDIKGDLAFTDPSDNDSGALTLAFANQAGAELRRSAGAGIAQLGGRTGGGANDDLIFNLQNDGTVNVLTGTLQVNQFGTTSTNGGSFTIGSGAVIDFVSGTHLLGNMTSSGAGTLRVSGATLSANAGASVNVSNLSFESGVLSGTGEFLVTGTASTWSGGMLSGTLHVGGSSLLTMNGTGPKFFGNGGSLVNQGTVNWTAGEINPGSPGSATITNALGGLFDIQGDLVLRDPSDNDSGVLTLAFVNQAGAQLRRSAGTGTAQLGGHIGGGPNDDLVFNLQNDGTFNVATGTVRIGLAGTTTSNAGSFVIGSGAVIDYASGTHTFTGMTSSGAGALRVSGDSVTYAGTSNMANLELTGGTLSAGTGALVNASRLDMSGGTLAGAGQFSLTGAVSTWSGGALSGNLRVAPGGTLTLNGSGAKLFANGGSLLNEGTVNWTAGNIEPAGGNGTATITNASGGVFDIKGDLAFTDPSDNDSGALTLAFANQSGAQLRRSVGAGIAQLGGRTGGGANDDLIFNLQNDGTVNVSAGTLQVNQFGTTSTNGGSFTIGSGAVIDFVSGTHALGSMSSSGAGTWQISGATVSVNGGATINASNLALNSGLLTGTGEMLITGSGSSWNGGSFSGNLRVASGGTLTLAGGDKALLAGGTLTNQGVVNWTAGNIVAANTGTATITNATGGVFDIKGDLAFTDPSDNDSGVLTLAFANQSGAQLRRSAGAGIAQLGGRTGGGANDDLIFNLQNDGTVNVLTGTLQVNQFGTTSTNGGSFTIGSGAVIDFVSGTHLLGNMTSSGAGTLRVSGATLSANAGASVNVSNLSFESGVLSGTGEFLVTGTASTWSGGMLSGTLHVGGSSLLTMNGTGPKFFGNGGSLVNQGTVNWTAGEINPGSPGSATITNALGGLFDIQGDLVLRDPSDTDSGVLTLAFLNQPGAELRRSVGAGTVQLGGRTGGGANDDLVFNLQNSGTVNVQTGTLLLNFGGFVSNTNSGVILAGSGATLSTNGNHLTNDPSGVIGGSGTLDLGAGTLTNQGTVRPGGLNNAGTLHITGHLQNGGGVLEFELGGNNPGGPYDVIAATGDVFLAGGTIRANDLAGYTTVAGHTYSIITASGGSITGTPTFTSGTGGSYSGAGSPTYVMTATASGGTQFIWQRLTSDFWDDSGNWTGNHVPGAGEIAVIDDPGVKTVEVRAAGGSQSVLAVLFGTAGGTDSMLISGGTLTVGANGMSVPATSTLTLSGGTLTATGSLTASTLNFSGGTLNGAGNVTVTGTGSTWSGGMLTGGGTLTVPTGAVLTLPTELSTRFLGNRTIENAGTVLWTGGNVDLEQSAGSATFNNAGLFDIRTGSGTWGHFAGSFGGTMTLANTGSLTRTVGSGVVTLGASIGNVTLNNSGAGAVQVSAGTLRLQAGGSTSSSGWQVDSGAVLDFNGGTHNLNAGAALTGAGTVQVSGATVNVASAVTVDPVALTVSSGTLVNAGTVNVTTLNFSGGALDGAGNVTATGAGSTWSGGMLTGGGTLTVPTGAVLTLPTELSTRFLGNRTIENAGTVLWTGGNVDLEQSAGSATFNNAGLFDIRTGSGTWGHFAGSFGGTMTLANTGSLTRTLGSGVVTLGASIGNVVLNNSGAGAVQVSAGTLRLQAGGSTSSSGWQVDSGAVLDFNGGTHNLNAGAALTGAGTVQVSGATVNVASAVTVDPVALTVSSGTLVNAGTVNVTTLNFSGGTLDGAGNVTATGAGSTWSGGMLTGGGTLTVPTGAVLTLPTELSTRFLGNRTIENAGTVLWTGGNVDLEQSAGSATFNNAGLFDIRTASGTWGHFAGSFGGTMTLANTGSLTRTVGTGVVTLGASIGSVTLTNSSAGLVQVSAGTLRLQAGGSTSSSGWQVDSGAVLDFNGGTHNLNAGAALTGAGTVQVSGATVNVASAVTVDPVALTVSSGTLVNAGTVNVTALNFSGGALDGAGNVTATGAGSTWSGGMLTGGGTLTVPTGAVLTLPTELSTRFLGNRTIENAGTVLWTGGNVDLEQSAGSATFNNAGLFDIRTASGTWGHFAGSFGGTMTLANTGSLTRTVGTGVVTLGASIGSVTLTNSSAGAVQVSTGTLRLQAGGGTSSSGWQVDSGAVLDFNGGTHNLNAGAALTGAGTVQVSGATVNVASAVTVDPVALTVSSGTLVNAGTVNVTTLNFSGGALDGAGNVTATGAGSTWSGGMLTGGGTLTVPTGAVLTLPTELSTRFLGNRTIENAGTVLWTGGNVDLEQSAGSATFNNAGLFDIRTASGTWGHFAGSFGGTMTLANTGSLTRTVGTGVVTLGASIGSVTLTNSSAGLVQVSAGTLTVQSFTANPGTITLSNDATLSTNSDFANTGIIQGAGTLNLGGTSHTLTNTGTIRPGNSTGLMSINGNVIFDSGGTFEVEIGGLARGTAVSGYDALDVAGSVTINPGATAVLSHVPGFTPMDGNPFNNVISATGGLSGVFALTSVPGFNYSPLYAANGFGLQFSTGAVTNSWSVNASGFWDVATNWSLGHVPTNVETVVIDRPGTIPYTVTVRVPVVPPGTAGSQAAARLRMDGEDNLTVASDLLTLGAGPSNINGTLTISGGTLTANGALAANVLDLSGGTLNGSGAVTVTNAMSWSGGTVAGSGAFNAANVAMSGASAKILDGRGMTMTGASNTWDGASTLSLNNGASLTNSGVFATSGVNANLVNTGAAATFTNNGTLAIGTSLATRVGNSGTVAFTNGASGVINVNSATFQTDSGGTIAGTVNLANGSFLENTGSGTLALSGVTINGPGTGSGTVRQSGANTLDVASALTLPSNVALDLFAGTVQIDAALTAGTLNLSGGTVNGSGNLTVTNSYTQSGGGTINIGGNASITQASGPLMLTNDITAANLTLSSTAGASQTGGAITATGLKLTGLGAFSLNQAGNNVTTLAADLSGAGSVSYTDTNAVSIGTVLGTSGLNLGGAASNTVTINAGSDISVTAGAIIAPAGVTLSAAGSIVNNTGGGTQIDTSAANGPITLSGAAIGATGRIGVNPGLGTVSAAAATGGIFLEQTAGDLSTSKYLLSATGSSQNISLATANGAINVDTLGGFNGNTANDVLSLTTAGTARDIAFSGGISLAAAGLNLAGTGKALFNAGTVTLDTPVTATLPIEISNGATVKFNGTPSSTGTLNLVSGTLMGTGGLTVNGAWSYTAGTVDTSLTLASGSSSTLTGVTVTGAGSILNQGLLNLSNAIVNPSFTNEGTLTAAAGTTNRVNAIANAGTIELRSAPDLTQLSVLSVPGALDNSGTIRVFNNTGMIYGNGTLVVDNAGTVANTGTLVNNGWVAPGASAGTLVVQGSFVQGPNGNLAIDVEVDNATAVRLVDVLDVTGTISLAGNLHVMLLNGSRPGDGDSVTIMQYKPSAGAQDFANAIPPAGYTIVRTLNGTNYTVTFFSSAAPPPPPPPPPPALPPATVQEIVEITTGSLVTATANLTVLAGPGAPGGGTSQASTLADSTDAGQSGASTASAGEGEQHQQGGAGQRSKKPPICR